MFKVSGFRFNRLMRASGALTKRITALPWTPGTQETLDGLIGRKMRLQAIWSKWQREAAEAVFRRPFP